MSTLTPARRAEIIARALRNSGRTVDPDATARELAARRRIVADLDQPRDEDRRDGAGPMLQRRIDYEDFWSGIDAFNAKEAGYSETGFPTPREEASSGRVNDQVEAMAEAEGLQHVDEVVSLWHGALDKDGH